MKEETRKKIEEDVLKWEYLKNLPTNWLNFKLEMINSVKGDCYELYRYVYEEKRLCVTVYYHEETREYKVRSAIGLLEFCRIEFITGTLAEFELLLKKHFEKLLIALTEFKEENLSSLIMEKGITKWEYGLNLPKEMEGFSLFINPKEPVQIAGGSYCILDYSDFSVESNLNLFYNIFRDEFFGEYRIRNLPIVTYDFDSKDLKTLEEKIKNLLSETLRNIRRQAEESEIKGN